MVEIMEITPVTAIITASLEDAESNAAIDRHVFDNTENNKLRI